MSRACYQLVSIDEICLISPSLPRKFLEKKFFYYLVFLDFCLFSGLPLLQKFVSQFLCYKSFNLLQRASFLSSVFSASKIMCHAGANCLLARPCAFDKWKLFHSLKDTQATFGRRGFVFLINRFEACPQWRSVSATAFRKTSLQICKIAFYFIVSKYVALINRNMGNVDTESCISECFQPNWLIMRKQIKCVHFLLDFLKWIFKYVWQH